MLFLAIVGKTSDAKGDSWGIGKYPFKIADPWWASMCIANGIGSGEGLIERIADEQTTSDKKGNPITIPGCTDKRCLVRLSELSRCFKVGRRENSTLSEYMREEWDGEPIHLPNRKGNSLSTTGYTLGVVADITPGVIRGLIAQGTESVDGFANRFLWCAVRSARNLPTGGNVTVLDGYLDRLKAVIEFGKKAGKLTRSVEAERLWAEHYDGLKTSGDSTPHTDRGRPYGVRLSMLYALADGVNVVGVNHLKAALAVWGYARASAGLIFGKPVVAEAEPEPLWLRLLSVITSSPGVSRSAILQAVKNIAKADEVGEALGQLASKGLAYSVMAGDGSRGPKAECWYPGSCEPKADGVEHYNPPLPHRQILGRFKPTTTRK